MASSVMSGRVAAAGWGCVVQSGQEQGGPKVGEAIHGSYQRQAESPQLHREHLQDLRSAHAEKDLKSQPRLCAAAMSRCRFDPFTPHGV